MKTFLFAILFLAIICHSRILRHSLWKPRQPAGPISGWNGATVMTAGETALNTCTATPDNCKSHWIFADLDDYDIKLYIFENDDIHALLRYLVNQYLKVPEEDDLPVFETSKDQNDLPRWWGMFHQRKYLDLPADPSNTNLSKMRDLSIKLCNAFTSTHTFSDPVSSNPLVTSTVDKYMHPLIVNGGGLALIRMYETWTSGGTTSKQTYFKAMNTYPFPVAIKVKPNHFSETWVRFPGNMISFTSASMGVQTTQITGDIFTSGRWEHPFLYPEMGSHNNSIFYQFPFTCPTASGIYVSQKEDGQLCNSAGTCQTVAANRRSHSDTDSMLNETYSIDWACPSGTDIIATRKGWVLNVLEAETRVNLGLRCGVQGNNVEVLHDDGSIAMYLHFNANSVPVKVGDTVNVGTVLGKCGTTGCSTGPHLHYTVHTYKYILTGPTSARIDHLEIEPLHPPVYKCGDPARTESSNRAPINLGSNPWGIADWNTQGSVVTTAPTSP